MVIHLNGCGWRLFVYAVGLSIIYDFVNDLDGVIVGDGVEVSVCAAVGVFVGSVAGSSVHQQLEGMYGNLIFGCMCF